VDSGRAASYHSDKLIKAPVGHFFDVMTNGFGAMPSYASRVDPDDRWRIAAYIRVFAVERELDDGGCSGGAARGNRQGHGDSAAAARIGRYGGWGEMNPTDAVSIQIGRWQRVSLMVGVVGTVIAIAGFVMDREQFSAVVSIRIFVLVGDGTWVPGNPVAASYGWAESGAC